MLNIAFIGCGGIARHHASRLTQLKGARIVAVADTVKPAATAFARDFRTDRDIAVFTDHRSLLRLDTVHAVWVCTPTFLHAAPAIAAARARKHVFCEKPMAMKLGDARRMARACDSAGVRFTVGFVRRFDTQWKKMKTVVQSGALGRPIIWRFAAGGRPKQPWFRDADKGGGPLMDGAVHNYDFALQMLGPVATVQASSLQFDNTSIGADTASIILTFASGDQHTLVWSWGMPQGTKVTGLNDLIGPNGALQFGMTAAKPPKRFDPERQGAFTLDARNGHQRVYIYPKRDMFLDQLKHVVTCFAKGEQPVVTAQDGIAALEVGAAVLKAGRTRRTITLAR